MSDLLLRFSIQRAAVWLLDRYYSDFPVYNPAVHNLPKSILSKKMTGFKVYSLDGKYELFAACPQQCLFNGHPTSGRQFKCCYFLHSLLLLLP